MFQRFQCCERYNHLNCVAVADIRNGIMLRICEDQNWTCGFWQDHIPYIQHAYLHRKVLIALLESDLALGYNGCEGLY